jgi:hypothetical protein
MSQAILHKILNQLQELETDELNQLNRAIKQRLVVKTQTAEQTSFEQALLESGLVKEIKQPTYRHVNREELIEVQGEPLSETIIEERR